MTSRMPARALCALIVVSFVLAGGTLHSAEIRWHTDLAEAEKATQETGKPLLIHFTASWCHYCHKMSKSTYVDAEVAAIVQQQFVPVKLDVDKNGELVKALRITAFPTAAIISSDFKAVHKISGFHAAGDFQKLLIAALQVPGLRQVAAVQTVEVAAPAVPETAAFGGRCLVSLIDEQAMRDGDARHEMIYRNRRLHFASARHLEKFAADPSRYWPACDGNCPVTKIEKSVEQAGDPRWGLFYDGRPWFFSSAENQAAFQKSPARFTAAAGDGVAQAGDGASRN